MILFFFLDFLINFLFRKFESVLVNLFVDCRLFDNGFINIDNVSVFGVFIFVDLFRNDVFFIFSLSSQSDKVILRELLLVASDEVFNNVFLEFGGFNLVVDVFFEGDFF